MELYYISPEFDIPDADFDEIKNSYLHYKNSEFQFLDDSSIRIQIPFGAEFEEADFYVVNSNIKIESEGRTYPYVLLLPLRINCIDEEFLIQENLIGYINMFKVNEIDNDRIYINEEFYKLINMFNPYGMNFNKI